MSRLLQEVRSCATRPAHTDEHGFRTMEFIFPPTFVGFDGHFPDRPILPGIVQVLAGMLTASDDSMTLHKVAKAKFSRVITPGELMLVRAETQKKDGNILATIIISVGGDTAATMALALHPKEFAE
ncbi:3-hydroxymyristoyl/3-hydroxydecanoyl-(acyl carrier protein) dehydratase [Desulfomicrobium macestii]|uniref:3-hydroxyacyl-[acyl-carrier-protein] dehydratase n=3 Tax=Desulfomicrobium TaxID=898 RepID=A0A8G2C3Q4_DESNO|nr:hypothetical protein [Desulfomicrobium macestii]MBE1426604.1 3-hydroxymyristoyl/3-hydroxydecanoyl-(acyl carrier protein) dehydratase [Desulfomicrobium macestii]SFL84919.1 3-hydroxyacyl-[acyl-carrier-protein] dehydratase [Desulfomicrobium norvegicum]